MTESTPTRVRIYTWMDSGNPNAGGDVRYLSEVAKRLVRDGFEVVWISGRFPGGAEREVIDGVRILRVGNIFTVYLAHHFKREIRLLRRADVTVETLSAVPFFLTSLGTRRDVAFIHHVVPLSQMVRKVGPLSVVAYAFDRLINPVLYRDRLILVPSESTLRDVQQVGYRRIKIFRPGSDVPTLHVGTKEHIVVAPGPIKPWKHHDDIIRAFALVDSDWKLVIFGTFENSRLESRLREIVETSHLEGRVEFVGHISATAKLELLRRAGLCILASEKEGWGLAAVESQAFGCPVVAYEVAGLTESVIDGVTGLLVRPRTYQALAQGLRDLINNEPLRARMASAGVAHAGAFDWESSYRNFRQLLAL